MNDAKFRIHQLIPTPPQTYVSQLTDTLRNMLVLHSAWTETMFATFQNIHTPFKLLIYVPFTFQSTKIFADFISNLSLFWSREQVEKWLGSVAKLVETSANAIALHPAVRSYWDKALFALLFMPVNDEKTGSSPMWLQLNSLTRHHGGPCLKAQRNGNLI